MAKVNASITISVDGYITGPNDGPGCGLGEGGERLHYWVMGGPWTYADEGRGEATGEDAAFLAVMMARLGAVVGGRATYEAAGHWGDENPFGVPMYIVTHRPEEQPDDEFIFVDGLEGAIGQAIEVAGERDVSLMGGADVIRQGLEAGLVDELTVIVAPVVLGAGKRLFEGFTDSLELEHIGLRQSPRSSSAPTRSRGCSRASEARRSPG